MHDELLEASIDALQQGQTLRPELGAPPLSPRAAPIVDPLTPAPDDASLDADLFIPRADRVATLAVGGELRSKSPAATPRTSVLAVVASFEALTTEQSAAAAAAKTTSPNRTTTAVTKNQQPVATAVAAIAEEDQNKLLPTLPPAPPATRATRPPPDAPSFSSPLLAHDGDAEQQQ